MEEMMTVYGPACERLGFQRDQDSWRNCILRLSAQEELRYRRYPSTTTCFGQRGFFDCTTY